MDTITTFVTPDLAFPFRSDGQGGVLQFKWKAFNWAPLIGNKDPVGYYLANWAPRGEDYKLLPRRFNRVHQIVWRVYHGDVPKGLEIDHIDGDKSNNNIKNLRLVTHAQNLALARARLGNWAPGKLKPHQRKLILAMPSNANWQFWADRWGVHKVSILTIRCQAAKLGVPVNQTR